MASENSNTPPDDGMQISATGLIMDVYQGTKPRPDGAFNLYFNLVCKNRCSFRFAVSSALVNMSELSRLDQVRVSVSGVVRGYEFANNQKLEFISDLKFAPPGGAKAA